MAVWSPLLRLCGCLAMGRQYYAQKHLGNTLFCNYLGYKTARNTGPRSKVELGWVPGAEELTSEQKESKRKKA